MKVCNICASLVSWVFFFSDVSGSCKPACKYLQRFDTVQWSRRVHPSTLWTAGPRTPGRRLRRRPLREPWGPVQPEATLKKKKKSILNVIDYLVSQLKCYVWGKMYLFRGLPVSLEVSHSRVPVELSILQLYQRSEVFVGSHTHQDF